MTSCAVTHDLNRYLAGLAADLPGFAEIEGSAEGDRWTEQATDACASDDHIVDSLIDDPFFLELLAGVLSAKPGQAAAACARMRWQFQLACADQIAERAERLWHADIANEDAEEDRVAGEW